MGTWTVDELDRIGGVGELRPDRWLRHRPGGPPGHNPARPAGTEHTQRQRDSD